MFLYLMYKKELLLVNKNVKYVWIPKSGTKYHYKKSCGGMRNPSKVKISVAKKKGYTACKKCVK